MASFDGNRRTRTTASRSRRTSQQMRQSTIGSHHGARASVDPRHSKVEPRVERMSRRSGNASAAGLSNPRRAKRATRGYVDQIVPTTRSGESSQAYSRRMNRRGFSQEVQRKSHLKRWGFIFVALLLIVGIGAAAAYFAFFASVDSKIASSDEALAKSLVAEEPGKPYYALLAADLNDYDGQRGIDAMMLARVDQANKHATLVMLPGNLRVSSDNGVVSLSALMNSEGEARVVSYVASSLNIGISHFLYFDRTAFTSVVDALGGVDMTLDQAVDDPRAGSLYLEAGEHTLDGNQAATLMMAYNYKEGMDTMFACQRRFSVALACKFFSAEGGANVSTLLDETSAHIATDWNARQLQTVFDAFKGATEENFYTAQVDGYDTSISARDDTCVFVPTASDVVSLMAAVDAGSDPAVREQKPTIDIDKDSFEITVRNGSGMTGGATMLADILENAGFTVAEKGNADSYVYTETLVIYLDPTYEKACEAVAQALGTGRVVNGMNGYTFDTEVLVVLGADWKPLN